MFLSFHLSQQFICPFLKAICLRVSHIQFKNCVQYEERKDELIDYDNNWAKEDSKNRLFVKLLFSKFTKEWSEPRRAVPLYGMHASIEWLFPVPLFY